MTLSLVPALPSELAYLAELSNQSLDSTLGYDALQAYLIQNALFSLHAKGQPIGFLVQQVVLDEAELIQILIDPLFCGRGFAATALTHWHRGLALQGVSRVVLEVRQTNMPALALYQRAGYQSVGMRKNYYHYADSLVDAWVMALNLPAGPQGA